jgi:hypothetical protein
VSGVSFELRVGGRPELRAPRAHLAPLPDELARRVVARSDKVRAHLRARHVMN